MKNNKDKNNTILLSAILFVAVSLMLTSVYADFSDVKHRLDTYRNILDGYVTYSNDLILSRIAESEPGLEDIQLGALREFNINLEICRDLQIISERYSIYLSWLSDLYLAADENEKYPDVFLAERIKGLKKDMVSQAEFDTGRYLPEFIPDITDEAVHKLSMDISGTLQEIRDYLKSLD